LSERNRRKPASQPPISRHPLFPAIVALWFGALFGVGSILINPQLIERAVVAAHIDSVIPMAAPPLGTTTRILLALALTGFGGLIGALLARRIARPKPEVVERRRGAASVSSEDREAPTYPPAATTAQTGSTAQASAGRRRPLAISEEAGDEEVHEAAPVPGSRHILNLTDYDFDSNSRGNEDARWTDDGFEVEDEFPAPAHDEPIGEAGVPSFAQDRDTPFGAQVFVAEDSPARSEDMVEAPAKTEGSLFAAYSNAIGAAPVERDEGMLEIETVTPDAATEEPAMAMAIESSADDVPTSEAHDAPLATEDLEAVSHEASLQEACPEEISPTSTASAAERIASAELDTLSPVELLERLAIAMEQRRAMEAAATRNVVAQVEPSQLMAPTPLPVEAEEPRIAPEDFATTEADDAGPGQDAEEIAPPPFARLPAALRPVELDYADHDDGELPGYIPPRHIALPADQSAATIMGSDEHTVSFGPVSDEEATVEAMDPDLSDAGEDEDDNGMLEAGYSSLLNLSKPLVAPAPFVRIEEPETGEIQPLVVFPGDEPASSETGPFARPVEVTEETAAPPAAPEASDDRLFDAPAAPEGARPGSAKRADAAETERALRAALATLQRMSGAA